MKKNKKNISLEESFKELEEIMNQIDSSDITLEEMIDYYKKGVDLIKYSQEKLSKAELTIKKINQDNKK
jgi:exodeoxyribonuclease VII small subunit|tara:strand:+ start:290 stop:496 length:207 start_codon:yes stop_codon:yes gene_type:complete